MIYHLSFLIIGFVFLIKGADFFVEGASLLAGKFHVSSRIIGLTIVAFGTSAPEAAISLVSTYRNSCDLAIGNIIGSNIFNVLFILGLIGCFKNIRISKMTYLYEIPFVLIISLLLLFLGKNGNSLSKLDGMILLVFFLLFLYYLFHISKSNKEDEIESTKPYYIILILLSIGIMGIVTGSSMTIKHASALAMMMGLSKRLIGLTIIAFGTSLPELVTSLVALIKGKDDLSVGNIIGSNIFNILFVLGITSFFYGPIRFINRFMIDGIIAIGSVMIFYFFINKKMYLKKRYAFLMIVFYFVYFISVFS